MLSSLLFYRLNEALKDATTPIKGLHSTLTLPNTPAGLFA
jgi:hypothetical protein